MDEVWGVVLGCVCVYKTRTYQQNTEGGGPCYQKERAGRQTALSPLVCIRWCVRPTEPETETLRSTVQDGERVKAT